MPRGFDTTASCQAVAANISQANYDFVCRYFGHNLSKCLTAGEATALHQSNVKVVTVWEDNPTFDSYFSKLSGVRDGASAYKFALQIGQPAGSCIYFAVDYDAAAAAVNGVISDYFAGIKAGFAAVDGVAQSPYSIGVYGSGLTCSTLRNANLADYSWLAGSTGWTGYATFQAWNIRQGASATLLGMGVDLAEATLDYGAF